MSENVPLSAEKDAGLTEWACTKCGASGYRLTSACGFTVRRKDTNGNPTGQRLTFTPESFVIEPLTTVTSPEARNS